jgi:acetylornithine aminotransferase
MAAAGICATYGIIRDEGLLERVRSASSRVVPELAAMEGVVEVRGCGYLLGVQCELPARTIQSRLLEAGVIVGTCSESHTIRLLPPLTLSDSEWDAFLAAFPKALEAGEAA